MLPYDRLLSETEFVAFDLETTGLFPVVDRIVEFGVVRFRLDGRGLGTWEQLVDPECLIPPEVTDIHGITDAMVRGQPTLSQALPGFLDFLRPPDTVLLAHNAPFDLGFLAFAAAKTGLALPANPVIDTLDLARTCVRGVSSHRLEALAVHLALATSVDHRALSDSRLVLALFRHLAGRLEQLRTVEDLFRLSPPLTADDSGTHLTEPPVGLEDLAVAISEHRTVMIVYDGGTRMAADRRITPKAMLQSNGRQYLLAYCHAAKLEKTYRLDRIREVRPAEAASVLT
ncbi:MAG: WYL domain-containing protein [Candidatus Anammoximicrobium sp.]|nr:WYL domain-containing protein [Candidatus Anammoximicrobium sp.]